MIRRIVTGIYTRITEKPSYILGRWGHHKDVSMWKKSDLNTEDHCGCDEMRQQYLHKIERIDHLIAQMQNKQEVVPVTKQVIDVENQKK
jgi:hypothetical protein